jgi:uncharacterized protein
MIALAISVGNAQSANPSFDCSKAQTQDERVICSDSRLAELDQAASIAYSQAEQKYKDEARSTARDALAARHSCGDDRLCILDQQVNAISHYSDLGSNVPIPPWAGTYRFDLFRARSEPPARGLPNRVGQCTITKIASISTCFGEELNHRGKNLIRLDRQYPMLMLVIKCPTTISRRLPTRISAMRCSSVWSLYQKTAHQVMTEGRFIRRQT